MRKVLTLVIISALVLGVVGTAFAEENNDLSAMITEGKIQAVIASDKISLLTAINSNLITLSSMRDSVVLETEATGKYSGDVLSDIGKSEAALMDLLKRTQGTKKSNLEEIGAIANILFSIEDGISHIGEPADSAN